MMLHYETRTRPVETRGAGVERDTTRRRDVGDDGGEGVGARARAGVRCDEDVAGTTTGARDRARERGGERERVGERRTGG